LLAEPSRLIDDRLKLTMPGGESSLAASATARRVLSLLFRSTAFLGGFTFGQIQ
jgi:hypothetical protein